MANFNHNQRKFARQINLCLAVVAGVDISQPITQADVAEGRRVSNCILLAAQVHPRAGEAVRRAAGYSWQV